MKQKITLIIGYAFPMYGYAYIFKDYFDLCTQVFIMTLLALLLEEVYSRDKQYSAIIGVMMISVFYAMIKQIIKKGTVYVWTDYVMWILIPLSIIGILIYDLVKTFKNDPK